MTHLNSLANLRPRKRGCSPHGFYPAGKCKECNRLKAERVRRRNGQKERPVGCSPHGWFPAADCSWCRNARRQKWRGTGPRIFGCSKHGYVPAAECKACKREWVAAKRARVRAERHKFAEETARLAERENREAQSVAKYDDKKTAVQRLLAPKADAMPTWERMWEYMDANRTPCFERPEDFIDYDDPRYPEEAVGRKIPSAFEARQLCKTADGSDCPLLELCGKFAAQNKEAAGVWGGKRYLDGLWLHFHEFYLLSSS